MFSILLFILKIFYWLCFSLRKCNEAHSVVTGNWLQSFGFEWQLRWRRLTGCLREWEGVSSEGKQLAGEASLGQGGRVWSWWLVVVWVLTCCCQACLCSALHAHAHARSVQRVPPVPLVELGPKGGIFLFTFGAFRPTRCLLLRLAVALHTQQRVHLWGETDVNTQSRNE